MNAKISVHTHERGKPGTPFSRWRSLRVTMTLAYIGVTAGSILVLQAVHSIVFLFVTAPAALTWRQLVQIDAIGLVIFSLIGGLFGIVATRGPIARLHRLTATTMRFAAGQYDQRLPARAQDEIGQLEAHFNQMAEHLVTSLAQQTQLAEQNARLEERARLSRDLHDSAKQHLFALAMQVEVALSTLDPEHTSTRAPLQEAEALIAQVQQELATLIHALRPTRLQTLGLVAALRDAVLVWSRQSYIEVDLCLPDGGSLPPPVEEALWWVAQEALSNVARHSRASKVHLCLEWAEQQVRLYLSDNGSGFDPAESAHEGLGLRSMRERMARLGGTVFVESILGEGTSLVAACPLFPCLAEAREHVRTPHE